MTPLGFYPWNQDEDQRQSREAENTAALVRFAIMLGAALLVASAAPPVLFAAAFSSFLFFFSVGSAIAAALGRERLFAPTLSRWDQAAALMALSMLARLFVDPVALEQAALAL